MVSRRKKKEISKSEALEIAKDILSKEEDFLGINWRNFRKVEEQNNTYRVTVEKLSLDALIRILEDENINNVYFHPSVAPVGIGVDGIALRYRLYFVFE